jgi:putative peptidoglycan lipid II flippase
VGAIRLLPPGGIRGDLALLRELVWLVLIAEIMPTVNTFLDKWFATGLEAGSISSLNYAWTLTSFGFVLFVTSLVTVMYPRMSEAITAGDLDGCSRYIRENLVKVSNLVVPLSLAAAVAAPEIVRVLFERGAFDAADSARTSTTMAMYLLGLPALIINAVVARIFHSLQLLRVKVWLALQFLVTNALLNLALIGPLKVQGLALASSLAINLHLALSLWVLHRRRSGLASGEFARVVGRAYVLGAVAMGIFQLIPIQELLASFGLQGAVGLIAAGTLKVSVVIVLYGLLLLGWRRASA